MVAREVERAEVVPVGLGFGAQRDGEAELAEDVLDLVHDERDRVFGAQPLSAARHCQVSLGLRASSVLCQRSRTSVDRFLDQRLGFIDGGTCLAPFVRLEGGQLFHQFGEPARPAPGEGGARLGQGLFRPRLADHGGDGVAEVADLFEKLAQSH
jgi:hypothetical protein